MEQEAEMAGRMMMENLEGALASWNAQVQGLEDLPLKGRFDIGQQLLQRTCADSQCSRTESTSALQVS